MLGRIGAHVRNQWAGFLALFLVIAGGTAAAAGAINGPAPGQNSVGSLDIINGQALTADLANNAVRGDKVRDESLTGDDLTDGTIDATREIANETVTGTQVANQSLTGADIAPRSGVDSCVGSVRLGSLCVRAENSARNWTQAVVHCGNLGMRAPTIGEALQLARTFDIPNADELEWFWTDERSLNDRGDDTFEDVGYAVRDDGSVGPSNVAFTWETVCVSTPVN